ncbi:MAG TPA: FAD-binding oxidoreductase [Gaiella sp.]|jgi:FAD/FMN-containing dehydrogenase
MSTTVSALESARAALPAFGDRLIGPDDPRYDEARSLFNAMIDKLPALIARCETPDDVAAAIRFARDHDLPFSVRGGGHNWGGLASVDEGLVIDLSPMKAISVDPATKTVRVGAGCVWGEVDAATGPHNLAVPTGIISTTGVAGLTLGGGHGYLTRRHGLTIDSLLSAKMVLADGSQVTASPDEHPDLFWAIRGGGGNFGVVTEFTFRAHPLETIVGGPTFWAIEDSDELLAIYREWLPSAPRNVSGFFNWHTIPPVAEAFPEELHLRLVCGIVWCIDGSDEEAEKAMAPFLSAVEPLLNGVQRMPIAALNSAFDGLYGPGDQWYARADFVREIPDEAMTLNREWNARMPTFKSGSHVYPIDGAVHDVAPEDTAFSFRDANWSQVFVGVDPDAASAAALKRWVVDYWEALHPYAAGGAYVNFMMDEGQERVKATYGPNYPRLQRVKGEYDPENVFRVNQNITPTA